MLFFVSGTRAVDWKESIPWNLKVPSNSPLGDSSKLWTPAYKIRTGVQVCFVVYGVKTHSRAKRITVILTTNRHFVWSTFFQFFLELINDVTQPDRLLSFAIDIIGKTDISKRQKMKKMCFTAAISSEDYFFFVCEFCFKPSWWCSG